MNILKAIYNFIVGDMIILVGVLLTLILLLLIHFVEVLAPLRILVGPILIIALLALLATTLRNEIRPKA